MSAPEKTKKKITRTGLKNALSIFSYITRYKGYFIGALTLLIIGSALMMIIMGIPGEMVNEATGKKTYLKLTLNQYGLMMLVALALRALLSFVQTILFANVSERGMADIRRDLYNKMIGQPMDYFEQHRVGELTSRITADVEQLQAVFSVTLAEFVRQVMILFFAIIFLAYLMPRLFLVMMLVIPVVVVLAMVFGRYIRRLSKKRQDQLAKTNVIVEETLQNFQIVKAFANEVFESKRFSDSVEKMVGISLSFAKVRGLFFAFIIFLLFGSILFILWRGAFMVQSGSMDAGNLLSFVIYTVMIGGAIASLGSLYTTIAGALGATERVKEILERPVEVAISGNHSKHVQSEIHGDIVFNQVDFSYPSRPDSIILDAVDIKIEKGQKVAIVGQSGGGKSTLIKLLMRFYDVQNGSISVDGTDIRDYDLTTFRTAIGLVPQDIILFGGSIRENLLYGNPDATEQEIIEAAKQANCWEFISSFQQGLNTIVGDRGVKLSGGQKQRVAIARTILKDPKILLLDEATSSLDAESEKVVQDAINNLMKDRTAIIVAHRLATIRDVDKIYVLANGQVAESGSHNELIQKDQGIYKNLANLQFNLKAS